MESVAVAVAVGSYSFSVVVVVHESHLVVQLYLVL